MVFTTSAAIYFSYKLMPADSVNTFTELAGILVSWLCYLLSQVWEICRSFLSGRDATLAIGSQQQSPAGSSDEEPGAMGNPVSKMTGTRSQDSVNKPNVDVYDVYSDAETSVSSPNQSGSLNSDWRCLTPSHKITVDSLLDRVENLGVIPGSYTTTSILEHIKNMWDPMNQDRDPEAEAASNNFVSGLECFSNLRSQIVDALPSYREEVQELLKNFPEKGKIVEQFLIQRYDIGTGTLPNQYSDLSLSKMTNQVLRRMEVDFKNNPKFFPKIYLYS